MSTDYPDGLRYTKEHEWARIEGKIATIGVTKFAVQQLGDVTQVDLPKEGETVKKDDVFGTVESVKAVSDVYAPLSGKIVKVNFPLADSPEYLNDEPYDEASAGGYAERMPRLLSSASTCATESSIERFAVSSTSSASPGSSYGADTPVKSRILPSRARW